MKVLYHWPHFILCYNCVISPVDAPCKMGCKGLSFCTNFNNRHTELFHHCNAEADESAKKELALWHQGFISLPYQRRIPVHGKEFSLIFSKHVNFPNLYWFEKLVDCLWLCHWRRKTNWKWTVRNCDCTWVSMPIVSLFCMMMVFFCYL